MIRLHDFFIGSPDSCERLVSALQFCLEGNSSSISSEEMLYAILEKGIFYRGMIVEFDQNIFSDQIAILLSKFTEFEM